MEGNKTKQVKMTFYKKAIGVIIMIAVAVYCIPELRDKLINLLDLITDEWRERR